MKIEQPPIYKCDYCGKETDQYANFLGYDNEINDTHTTDVCSKECFELYKKDIKNKWECDKEFREWLTSCGMKTYEKYIEDSFHYNKIRMNFK